MKLAYLGLGSNLGNRQSNLAKACELLVSDRQTMKRVSSTWETAPRDVLDQPFFLNQVVEIETDLFPRQLLTRAKQVEHEMGRVTTRAKGPRVIDIDVLLYANAIVNTGDLKIPHPALHERRFVLEPLAELVPGLRHPLTKQTVQQMLTKVAAQEVRKI
jgi:2-amino-4-hydroxy-6-hydroxymethyldihydropteridine diphosphokinase